MDLGFRWPRLTPDTRRLLALAVPGIITGGINQVNLFIGTTIASLQASAVSFLYFADRINQLPLGMVGIAIGVVLLPTLTRHLAEHDEAGAMASQNRSLEFALLLTLPATVALIIIPRPIIQVLFQHGTFTAVRHRTSLRGAGGIRLRAARLCHEQGVPAGLFRARGHGHAHVVRGRVGGREYRGLAHSVPGDWAMPALQSRPRFRAGRTRSCSPSPSCGAATSASTQPWQGGRRCWCLRAQ